MILVTGGTGNVGVNVVRQLLDAGEKVRVVTRNPSGHSLPDGVDVVYGDLGRAETLPAVLSGIEQAFLFPASTGVGGFLDTARQAGLRHVVLLSSSTVLSSTPGVIGERHVQAEEAVAASGVPWTFVRPGAFMTNDLVWAAQIMNGDGVVRGVYGDAATAPVDPRDIAAVAVRALLDRKAGEAYELTGPQSLTQHERVQIIAEAVDRPLKFEEVPREQFQEQMLANGMPATNAPQETRGQSTRSGEI